MDDKNLAIIAITVIALVSLVYVGNGSAVELAIAAISGMAVGRALK
jgi:hypothetical protein